MGVITPETAEPKGATCASKLANARPRRLYGSQKIPGRALVSASSGEHDSTVLAGTNVDGTVTGFEVRQLLTRPFCPYWRSPAALVPRTASTPWPKAIFV